MASGVQAIAKKAQQLVAKLATRGSAEQMDRAVEVVLNLGGSEGKVLGEIFSTHLSRLEPDSKKLLPSLKIMALIAHQAPGLFATEAEDTRGFIIDDLLKKTALPGHAGPDDEEDEEEWSELVTEECSAKILGIKVLVSELMGLDPQSYEQAQEVAAWHIDMLFWIIVSNGDLIGGEGSHRASAATVNSRLRLEAACGVLDLCANVP